MVKGAMLLPLAVLLTLPVLVVAVFLLLVLLSAEAGQAGVVLLPLAMLLTLPVLMVAGVFFCWCYCQRRRLRLWSAGLIGRLSACGRGGNGLQ